MKKTVILLICFIQFFSFYPMTTFASIINTEKTYYYEDLQDDVWVLKNKFKKEVELHTIGKSEYGRKIYALRLGKGSKSLLITGAHHGREWITSLMVMKMAEQTAKALKESRQDLDLDDYSIWLVPMVNPDGVTVQQGRLDKFPFFARRNMKQMNEDSSNFSRWKSNALGVDLNRQYPIGWKDLQNTSKHPSYKNYKGKKPLEAKEVQALVAWTNKIQPLIAISYHSSGQEIFWNYNNGENEKRDQQIAQKLAALTGYTLNTPDKDAVGGGYTDWFISTYKLPAFTIEICPLVEEEAPSITTFPDEWEKNKQLPTLLIQEAKKLEKNT